ncbi:phage XkdN-like family protein [Clostridioides difficile CD160]|nr:phage XkdN-like family protein [Clostridioides difficile CD160]
MRISAIKTMLTAGEYINYRVIVNEVNGFDTSFEDKIEEAKTNSRWRRR